MRIRRIERRDIPAVFGLINQVQDTFPRSLEVTEREYERVLYRVDGYGEKFVGELDGEVIALLGLTQNPLAADGPALNLTLIVDCDQRGRGYGRRLWELVEKRLELLRWKRLLVSISAAEAESVEWFARRGLKRVHEERFFRLDLTDYRRPDDFTERLAAAEEAGYVLERVGGIDDLDAEEKLRSLWDIWSAAEADVPHGVSYEQLPFERWREMTASPIYDLEGMLVARYGGEFVGVTGRIYPAGRDKAAFIIITGVKGDHRRRGLATALKYRDVEDAAAEGVPALITGNAVGNAGILRINERLGFRPTPSVLTLVREAEDA